MIANEMSIGSLRVSKLRPRRLVVRLDGWVVFRQRQLGAYQSVHVTVGDVMNDLPDCPAFRPIRSCRGAHRSIR